MIHHMHIGETITEDAVEAKLAEVLRNVETEEDPNNPGKLRIHQRRFLMAIGAHQIRGTSKLCRIGRPICACISAAIFARTKHMDRNANRQLCNVIEQPYASLCIGCQSKKPVLNEMVIKINSEGYPTDQIQISLPVSRTSQKQPRTKSDERKSTQRKSSERRSSERRSAERRSTEPKSIDLKKKAEKSKKTESLQTVSSVESLTLHNATSTTIDTIDPEAITVARDLIKAIREFAPMKGSTANAAGLLATETSERETFLNKMAVIERALVPVLKTRRWVPVLSPAVVVGDLHGNLDDLLTLERSLWKRFPLTGPNLVFLGDMVDRGKWGVECATYLMCMAVLAPSKVTILRGNHEVSKTREISFCVILITLSLHYRSVHCKCTIRIETSAWTSTAPSLEINSGNSPTASLTVSRCAQSSMAPFTPHTEEYPELASA